MSSHAPSEGENVGHRYLTGFTLHLRPRDAAQPEGKDHLAQSIESDDTTAWISDSEDLTTGSDFDTLKPLRTSRELSPENEEAAIYIATYEDWLNTLSCDDPAIKSDRRLPFPSPPVDDSKSDLDDGQGDLSDSQGDSDDSQSDPDGSKRDPDYAMSENESEGAEPEGRLYSGDLELVKKCNEFMEGCDIREISKHDPKKIFKDDPKDDLKKETTETKDTEEIGDLCQVFVAYHFNRQMMFVSGETAEPSIETTSLIEDITRQQVIEILTRSTALATRRGSKTISTDDLIFLIRHDKAKVSRLQTFLSWKDVRKNVKDSDDKGGADTAEFAADDAAGVVAGPSDVASKPKNKRAKIGLAWDVNSFFSVQVPEREDEEDEEEEEQNYATLQRLAAADERTRHMTKEEYVFWSECRQASFTYRKSKRFREWAGFGIVTESKPNDDIVDILGFLTFEIVQTLTEEALKVKLREDHERNRGGGDNAGDNSKKRKRETGLFDPPEEGRTPIEPRHIREAYRKLQAIPQKSIAMLLHNGRIPARLPLRLI
ncbi:SAGA complex subunit spt3 [Penicillium argentinense]|uniref:SAGA complex subunit spt3 n=1 Tax=Penicillium argentinense TaxID=1131581 RepID=A0A9W9EIB3_9EURO|nr:SAGA complex subunit spt3 [Penicillium argentinense]KAJ5082338.1 SAGA complex subunit spt3 [Penicillium argentinense]